MQTEQMKQHLVALERIINLNTYQKKQALYRNFEPIIGLLFTSPSCFNIFCSCFHYIQLLWVCEQNGKAKFVH